MMNRCVTKFSMPFIRNKRGAKLRREVLKCVLFEENTEGVFFMFRTECYDNLKQVDSAIHYKPLTHKNAAVSVETVAFFMRVNDKKALFNDL